MTLKERIARLEHANKVLKKHIKDSQAEHMYMRLPLHLKQYHVNKIFYNED
jgi:hypothetical protein